MKNRKLSHVLHELELRNELIIFEQTPDHKWNIILKYKGDNGTKTFGGYINLKEGLFAVESILDSRRK